MVGKEYVQFIVGLLLQFCIVSSSSAVNFFQRNGVDNNIANNKYAPDKVKLF